MKGDYGWREHFVWERSSLSSSRKLRKMLQLETCRQRGDPAESDSHRLHRTLWDEAKALYLLWNVMRSQPSRGSILRCLHVWSSWHCIKVTPSTMVKKRHGNTREIAGSQKMLYLGNTVDPGRVLYRRLRLGMRTDSVCLLPILPSGI